ncbi:hypothetical protein E2C01_032466 [Portunus trituberculatus]|uniref:Uncharacterized protein n=1 Tax=Portunus trituberculatus TaxID=210409 RepID=A0A5B7F107_PORTR|nr:hypothetical protein [Portunus trituberculatus]
MRNVTSKPHVKMKTVAETERLVFPATCIPPVLHSSSVRCLTERQGHLILKLHISHKPMLNISDPPSSSFLMP